ncbi:hypothetical protein NQZ70_10521 [Sorangium sp. Soce836]|nr:hypothetical protein NQZ70_10521 [Sorangium sp. Soce836]
MLNAFRHHSGVRVGFQVGDSGAPLCSTPSGITAGCGRAERRADAVRVLVLNAFRHHGGVRVVLCAVTGEFD